MSPSADYPDNDPIPQMSVVTPGTAAVSNGADNAVIVDPGANGAVRLWTVELVIEQNDTGTFAEVAIEGGAAPLANLPIGPKASAATANTWDKLFMNFGGVVLPKGAKLQVSGAGLSYNGFAYVTYTLT